MRLKRVDITRFRRFHDLSLEGLPESAELVVMMGPNGSGKSSVFDAFAVWYGKTRGDWANFDSAYHLKQGLDMGTWTDRVDLEFHTPLPTDGDARKKLLYIRSAYRNEAEFTVGNVQRSASALDDGRRVRRMIDNDVHVSDNYQRMVAATIEAVWNDANDARLTKDLREELIGEVRQSMGRVFPDLLLSGTGSPLADGSFYFTKGTTSNFHYKNLSGGEKAAFDLLLDLVVKRHDYNDTVFCIDEPDQHMSTRLQAALLGELFLLIPTGSQLWITTHSVGMLSKALELHRSAPGRVAFLDFSDKLFDAPCKLTPSAPDRRFWSRALSVALDDMAKLVAPEVVVLCEGRPSTTDVMRAEFDAHCYRTIFAADYPQVEFVSVGGATSVSSQQLEAGRAIQLVLSSTKIVRLVDRDDRSPTEVSQLQTSGVRVLSRRHLESYLMDDDVLTALCVAEGKPNAASALLTAKRDAIQDSVSARSNPQDDVKSAAGPIYNSARQLLGLVEKGSDAKAFCRDTLAPLVRTIESVYAELRKDVFGV